jgi:hypothetical protein
MLRSIFAVIVGYVIFAASGFALFQLSGRPPHGEATLPFKIGAVAYGIAFALAAGYVGAFLSGRRPLVHGAAVAAILALGATASLIATVGRGAIWSQACALAFMAPAAIAGGWLRGRRAKPAC